MLNIFRKRLDSLPMGNHPWSDTQRSNTDKILDESGIEHEERRRLIKEEHIV